MARVTVTEVEEIMEALPSWITDAKITAFITAANLMVTDIYQYSTDASTSLKKEIERWLTAHMLTVSLNRMARREQIGEAEIEYIGRFGEGLKGSPYGQMVLELDTTGLIQKLGKQDITVYAIPSFD